MANFVLKTSFSLVFFFFYGGLYSFVKQISDSKLYLHLEIYLISFLDNING